MSNLVLFIFGVGMFGANFLVPIYLQNSLGYTPYQAGLVFLPVGILVGITAPFAGMFADRWDARVPVLVGLGLLALTMHQFSFLSLSSEKPQILLPLYLRGIAMGLLMSPLTTVAISEISNRKMAQASGLINVIRQIGGSFGVALFGTILTRRTIFHAAMYGEQIRPYSEAYEGTDPQAPALRAPGHGRHHGRRGLAGQGPADLAHAAAGVRVGRGRRVPRGLLHPPRRPRAGPLPAPPSPERIREAVRPRWNRRCARRCVLPEGSTP